LKLSDLCKLIEVGAHLFLKDNPVLKLSSQDFSSGSDQVSHPYKISLLPQIGAETVFLLCASGIGLYYRHMTEAAHHNTFVGTRTCIESRVKLECEKEQQEQLLLSVIPAYIAAEVSAMWILGTRVICLH